jgi:2-polyprenyl-3-methyl-5-hydroxy-6-metoxy-1,4-benzoquinol methylase
MKSDSNQAGDTREPLRAHSIGEQGKRTLTDAFGVLLSRVRLAVFYRYIKKSPYLVELLDVGCGYEAHLSIDFISKVKRLILADVSINMNLLTYPNVEFLKGDLSETLKDLKDESIDLVIASNVIEHLNDPSTILLELKRLLKPNGLLMIIVPNWRGKTLLEFLAFKLKVAPAYEINDHKRYFSKSELWIFLRSAGFKPENIKMKTIKFGTCSYAIISNPIQR